MNDDVGSPDEKASVDDPDWVEQMLARALDSADDEPGEGPSDAPATPPSEEPESEPEQRDMADAPETAEPPAVEATGPVAEVPEPPAATAPEVSEAPPSVADPYAPAEDDDAAWSSWAAGGVAPAAADKGETAAPQPDWTNQQPAATVAAGAVGATVVMADPGYEDEFEEIPRHKSRTRSIIEWGVVVVGAVVIALLIKQFLFQAFYIPSGSMEPTLSENDRVLVNKLSYDFHDVNRGDIVVFDAPEEGSEIKDLIKRVIGLSGETVTFTDQDCSAPAEGGVLIDNREVTESYLKEQASTQACVENIPNCAEGSPPYGCTIPDGMVFVMGDNREDSRDARWFGPIEESTITGRAFIKIWPITDIGFL